MVSVIIPIYNASPYLTACIKSLLSQTETNWEAILIDDGSTDDSSSICLEYTKKDSRIRCFKQANGGVSSARNTGLSHAQGEWICFVDADDILPKNALQTLLQRTKNEKYDLIIGGYEEFDSSNKKTYWIEERNTEVLNKGAALSLMYRPKYYRYLGLIGGKLFKATIIHQHNIHFSPEIYFNEDRLFVTQFISSSNSILFFTDPVYHYYQRPFSAMGSIRNGFNRQFLTDLDGYIGMKEAVLSSSCSKQLVKLADEGIAASYWRITRMMKQFHASSPRLVFTLQKKVLCSVTLRSYLLYIIKPFLGNILRRIGLI